MFPASPHLWANLLEELSVGHKLKLFSPKAYDNLIPNSCLAHSQIVWPLKLKNHNIYGELYFSCSLSLVQSNHLYPFPRIECFKIHQTKWTRKSIKIISNTFKLQVSSQMAKNTKRSSYLSCSQLVPSSFIGTSQKTKNLAFGLVLKYLRNQ